MSGFDALSWPGLLRRPFAAPERIREYQDRRVRALARQAALRVPFYRRWFREAGVRAGDIGGVADLKRLPVLTKTEYSRRKAEGLVAEGTDERRCLERMSSGTTGEPVRNLRTRGEEYILYACRLRAQMLSGLRPRDVRLRIGAVSQTTWAHRLGLFRYQFVDDGKPFEALRAEAYSKRFDILDVNPELMELLLPEGGERLRRMKLKRVFTGAELMTPGLRRRIEETVGCGVGDFYGATEVNLVAWECVRCGLYHLCEDGVYAEVLKADGSEAGPGEEGRLVVTPLHSFVTPMIRYEIGDVVRRPAGRRACAIRFSTIDRIEGRLRDYLPLPGGRWLSPIRVIVAVQALARVRRYRVAQTALDAIEVWIEPEAGFSREDAERVRKTVEELAEAAVKVEVKVVETLPQPPGANLSIVQAWREPSPPG